MIETLKNAFRNKDIRKKIIFTLLLLLLFRVGCYIPIPGLTRDTFASAVTGNDFLALMSGITGSALANGTLFALGIGPYINASIIMQLLTVGIPALERLSKQGEEGRKKITNITRFVTIILAIVQSIGLIVLFGQTQDAINLAYFGNVPGGIGETGAMWVAGVFMTIVYTAGSCLVMWIGERITEYGVGNGISMIISSPTTLKSFGASSPSSSSPSSCSSPSSTSTLPSARSPSSMRSRSAAPRCTAGSPPSSP